VRFVLLSGSVPSVPGMFGGQGIRATCELVEFSLFVENVVGVVFRRSPRLKVELIHEALLMRSFCFVYC
jgi:hypothetical protein